MAFGGTGTAPYKFVRRSLRTMAVSSVNFLFSSPASFKRRSPRIRLGPDTPYSQQQHAITVKKSSEPTQNKKVKVCESFNSSQCSDQS